VENTGILTPIAGVAMSFVGFTGLLITWRGGPGHGEFDEFELFQLMSVVVVGLTVLFGSLGVIVFADLLGPSAALRVTSVGLGVVDVGVVVWSSRRLSAMRIPDHTSRESRLFEAAGAAALIVFVACALAPGLPLFELGLLLFLALPALVFRFVLVQLARRR